MDPVSRNAATRVVFAATYRNMPQYAARRRANATAQIMYVDKCAYYALRVFALKLSKRTVQL